MMDEVKNRTGVTYEEAKDALEKADSVIEAIILIERKQNGDFATEETETGKDFNTIVNDAIAKLKELVAKGNVSKIIIRRDENELMTFPVNAGVVGGALGLACAPWAMIAGAVIGYGAGISIDVENEDGTRKTIFGK